MIISKNQCHEEARRQIDILSEVIAGMKDFGILEGIVFQILGIDPSEYIMERGYK